MHRFVVLYRAPENVAQRFARATPEQAQQGLRDWIDWAARLGPALLDPGKPLGNPVTVTATGITHLRFTDSCEITVLEEVAIPELESAG